MKVEVKELTKMFGETKAVDSLSFSFETGQVIGFVGPNGAGKTTTMRIMATLTEPTAGDVMFDGVSAIEYPDLVRQKLGFMPDGLPSFNDITAHEYIDFFGRAFGLRGSALRKAVDDVEDFTGIGTIRDKVLTALSKGMKQRVSLARALVHNPDVMIMDEPANGLDPRARIELRELVKALAENGKAILVSSHILTELAEMCTGVQIIEQGRLVTGGEIDEIAHNGKFLDSRCILVKAVDTAVGDMVKRILELPAVKSAKPYGIYCQVETNNSDAAAADLLAALLAGGIKVSEFKHVETNLEDVFMNVTKGNLA